ncbi:hypothetical protein SALBM135S_06511 [Streptomyces alboniger]
MDHGPHRGRCLRQLGVRAEGAHLSASRSRRIDREGLELAVRTERTVTIMADGRERTIRTNAATVREVVAESGVTLRGQDTTSVAPDSFPRDGQTITVMRVTGSRETREEAIPFDVERTADPTLFRGTEVVAQAGRPGARRVTYALRSVNGVQQRPRRIGSEIVREPRKQIVKVGTKPQPTSVAGAEGWTGPRWPAASRADARGRWTPRARTAASTSSTPRPGNPWASGRHRERARLGADLPGEEAYVHPIPESALGELADATPATRDLLRAMADAARSEGDVQPVAGRIAVGRTVKLAYLSQEVAELKPTLRVLEAVQQVRERVDLGKGREMTAGQLVRRSG